MKPVAEAGIHFRPAHRIAQQELIPGNAAAAVEFRQASVFRSKPVPASGGFLAIERSKDEVARFQEIAPLVGDYFDDSVKPLALAPAFGEGRVFRAWKGTNSTG